jgi:polyhydroxyalkanoate synthesis regulator protein
MSFYGDTLQTLLACYLEFSLLTITNKSIRRRMARAGTSAIRLVDEQVQQNTRLFETMLSSFVSSNPESKMRKPDHKC